MGLGLGLRLWGGTQLEPERVALGRLGHVAGLLVVGVGVGVGVGIGVRG